MERAKVYQAIKAGGILGSFLNDLGLTEGNFSPIYLTVSQTATPLHLTRKDRRHIRLPPALGFCRRMKSCVISRI